MNLFKIAQYQLYLLQIENYEISRFLKLLFQRGIASNGELRKALIWTLKAKVLFALAEAMLVCFTVYGVRAIGYAYNWHLWQEILEAIIVIFLLQFFFFIFLARAWVIITPADKWFKIRVVGQAKKKLQFLTQRAANTAQHAGSGPLVVIGIAGSFGKTTMKETLAAALSSSFKVQKTSESVNTPVGIARWIMQEVAHDTQVIVVEMGEHYPGDVKELCDLLHPDISVITGINEAHMERFGNLDTAIATIFEAAVFAKPDAKIVINADSVLAVHHFNLYVGTRKTVWYSSHNSPLGSFTVSNVHFDQRNLQQTFNCDGEMFTTKLLGEYAIGNAVAALLVGRELGLSVAQIKLGLAGLLPVEHRLQPIVNPAGLIVIDDSYNGNPDGVTEAIRVLGKFQDHRKIYLTPGLVEMGQRTQEVHVAIGKQLANVADVVILIKNSVTPYIVEGLKSANNNQSTKLLPEIIWFDSAPQAHKALSKIVKPNDVIVFQNDWGDNYM